MVLVARPDGGADVLLGVQDERDLVGERCRTESGGLVRGPGWAAEEGRTPLVALRGVIPAGLSRKVWSPVLVARVFSDRGQSTPSCWKVAVKCQPGRPNQKSTASAFPTSVRAPVIPGEPSAQTPPPPGPDQQ